ncbi:MAG: hypothetical protein LPL00_08175 [Alphaproteobacteria bacterium]|nr:hypothetical protein [Alphaproteobacteria bacterium]MDX5369570.1 hypothetical protein [Alphaproteobacteria bacterium]MDX5464224.1 hypothetical protein [Alphaproteobacteria bacterium]
MRLKTFTAPTMDEALAEVRRTLGPDALLVSRRHDRARGRVEVLAAVEPEGGLGSLDAGLHARLAGWAESFRATDGAHSDGTPGAPRARLALRPGKPRYRFRPVSASEDLLLLTGLPGAGVSLTAVRLAAQAAARGREVSLIAFDPDGMGPGAPLSAYGPLLGGATTARSVADAVALAGDAAVAGRLAIVDGGAFTPCRRAALTALAQALEPADRILGVLAAGTDAGEAAEAARDLRIWGADSAVVTRCDLSRRICGVTEAVADADLALCAFGVSARPTPGCIEADAVALDRLILGTMDFASLNRSPAPFRRNTRAA